MRHVLIALEWAVLLYFVVAYTYGTVLNLLAIPALRRKTALRPLEDLPPAYAGFEPPVSLLLPAANEEATIAAAVRSLLELDYPEFEVVVVNDGSTDGTLAALQEAFDLEVFPEAHWRRLPTKAVRAIYHSRTHATLRVVDKDPGGKADALNAGINASRYPLFCAVDAGWILQRDSLRRVVEPFVDDPSTVVSAAAVRMANGCTLSGGNVERADLPSHPLALLQLVEHLGAVLFAGLGWATLKAALVIPGAIAVLRKDAIVEAGGYRADIPGEDVELVVRLHCVLRARGEKHAIHVVPDAVCWTQAPEAIARVGSQRIHGQCGLCESLHRNRRLLRQGGGAGLAYPFFMVFECYGPLIELAGYAFMSAMWMAGQVSGVAFVAFLALAFSLGLLLSMSALWLEELSFHQYPRFAQAAALLGAAIAANLGFRQLVALWRVIGLTRWLQGAGRQGEEKSRSAPPP